MPTRRDLPVGLELGGDGAHPAARTPSPGSPARLARAARAAEEAGLSFVTLGAARPADAHGRLDPVEAAAYLAAVTARIGLVVETPVVGAEPFHLANRLASLDWAAQGRAGWAVPVPGPADVSEVREVVDAVRTLWDTWEDGVLLADEATGRFLDLERWHYADVQGERFSVKGPAITPRPPQGHLPVIGAEAADVVRVGGADVPDALARADAARRAGAIRVLLDVEVLVDADRPAADRLAALDAVTPWRPTAALRVSGSPDDLLEALREVVGHVDAVRLDPAVLDVDLPVLAARVLPAWAPPQGGHLRDLLRLDAAPNRFTERRARSQQDGDAA